MTEQERRDLENARFIARRDLTNVLHPTSGVQDADRIAKAQAHLAQIEARLIMTITVRYSSIDRYHQKRTFKTLAGAQRFAQKWIGATPELGQGYAVSGDGVGRITVEGAKLTDLFPKLAPQEPPEPTEREIEVALYGRGPVTRYLPDYAPDAPGYGERVWNDDGPDQVATESDAMAEYARNIGGEEPEREWLLTSYDVWVRNPHYRGKPGRHPEEDPEDHGDGPLPPLDADECPF